MLIQSLEAELVYASAVIFAAIISLLVPYVSYRLSRRGTRASLRQSLSTEISSMDWMDEHDLDHLQQEMADNDDALAHAYVPTEIYDSHIENIGLLSEKERRPLIQYYQTAHIAQEQLNILREEPQNTKLRERFAYNTLKNLCEARNEAESMLKD